MIRRPSTPGSPPNADFQKAWLRTTTGFGRRAVVVSLDRPPEPRPHAQQLEVVARDEHHVRAQLLAIDHRVVELRCQAARRKSAGTSSRIAA